MVEYKIPLAGLEKILSDRYGTSVEVVGFYSGTLATEKRTDLEVGDVFHLVVRK